MANSNRPENAQEKPVFKPPAHPTMPTGPTPKPDAEKEAQQKQEAEAQRLADEARKQQEAGK